ncbi:hypothetical protein C8Q74DRAFT_1370615 [Fomes fomentarius]|nr:hypothetical protein C8Q74DRAFT_1370615 [Fomes fomentarius]
MQLAPVANLPVELLDMVLEVYEDDRETLKTCSLVCRFWRKVTLRYLFEYIVNRSASSFEDLLHFLRHHPHVAERIATLTLTGPKCDADANYIFPRCDIPMILAIVQCLPNDLDLGLERVQILDTVVQEERAFAADKLKLCGDGARFTFRNQDLADSRAPLYRFCVSLLQAAPRRPPTSKKLLAPNHLKSLHLTFHDWAQLIEIGQVLHHVSESLKNLLLIFANALDNHRSREHERGNPSWVDEDGIAAFLSQFPKAIPLQRTGVVIRATYMEQYSMGPHPYIHCRTKIEDALLQFENLDEIGFEVRGYEPHKSTEEGWMHAARFAFPKLASMGKLNAWELDPEPYYQDCW